MISKEDMKEWAIKYISRNARKSHPDYDEFVRRTKYMVNKFYDSIGSCGECKHKHELPWCYKIERNVHKDWYCADFEREE